MTARRLLALFSIEPGEGRLVVLMLACSFFVGSAVTLSDTAAYALFVSQFGVDELPYVYMALSVVVTSLSFAYLRLSSRLSGSHLLILTVAFGLLLLIGLRLGMSLTGALWLTFALPVGTELANSFTRIAFWNLAGRVFNVRQAKRLIGLIGVGSELAGAAGGFAIPLLVLWMGTPNLLLAAAVTVALAGCLILWITRSYAVSQSDTGEPAAAEQPSRTAWWKNRYILLILGMFALYVLIWYVLDVVFYDQAALRYGGEDQMASFLGLVFGFIGLLNLLGHSFLTSPVLKRYGVRGGLLVTPVVLLAGSLMILVGAASGADIVVFWLVAGLFLLFYFTTSSIDAPVLNILYQPLPPAQRLETQTLVEGVVYSVSIGLAGVALWAIAALWDVGPSQLSYVVLILAALWTAASYLLGKEYPDRLRQALARRRLGTTARLGAIAPRTGGVASPLPDGSTEAILRRELMSPSPGAVTYALSLLEEMGSELVPPCLPSLLDHPSPAVRQDVLHRLERLRVTAAAAAIRRRLDVESSPAVFGGALRTLTALAGAHTEGAVLSYLGHPEPEIRRGALVGLLRYGGPEERPAATSQLLRMTSSPEASERVLAAETMGDVGSESFCEPLLDLLHDPVIRVERAAVLAAGKMKSERLWHLVVQRLGSRHLRGAAAAALAAGGYAVLPVLFVAYAESPEHPSRRRRHVSMCGRIGGPEAVAWLREHLAEPNGAVRTEVLHALCRCGYSAAAADEPKVVEQLKAEAAISAAVLAAQADLGLAEPLELLQSALLAVLDGCRRRLFFLLSFLHDRELILQARDNLALDSSDSRAYALELLDVRISPELKRWFFPLLSDLPAAEKARQMRALFPQPARTRDDRLEEIFANRSGLFSPWLQACALYAAGLLASTLAEAIAGAAAAPDPLVRETALWATRQQQARPGRPSGAPTGDQGLPAATAGLHPQGLETGGKTMLTTVEKVLALKKAAVFSEVPDETLAELAACLVEVESLAGQTVFEKGDRGDSMYIIADGSIRIHDAGRTLDSLGPGEVFGEMAVLDAEPRSASATASADALLLRLDQEALYEAMEDRIEVARGIIRALSRRLRARMSDLARLRSEGEY